MSNTNCAAYNNESHITMLCTSRRVHISHLIKNQIWYAVESHHFHLCQTLFMKTHLQLVRRNGFGKLCVHVKICHRSCHSRKCYIYILILAHTKSSHLQCFSIQLANFTFAKTHIILISVSAGLLRSPLYKILIQKPIFVWPVGHYKMCILSSNPEVKLSLSLSLYLNP